MAKRTDQGVSLEQITHNLSQGATPLAVDQAHLVQPGQVGVVEVAIEPIGYLMARQPRISKLIETSGTAGSLTVRSAFTS